MFLSVSLPFPSSSPACPTYPPASPCICPWVPCSLSSVHGQYIHVLSLDGQHHRACYHGAAWRCWNHHWRLWKCIWACTVLQTASRCWRLHVTPLLMMTLHNWLYRMTEAPPTSLRIHQTTRPCHDELHRPGSVCWELTHPKLFMYPRKLLQQHRRGTGNLVWPRYHHKWR